MCVLRDVHFPLHIQGTFFSFLDILVCWWNWCEIGQTKHQREVSSNLFQSYFLLLVNTVEDLFKNVTVVLTDAESLRTTIDTILQRRCPCLGCTLDLLCSISSLTFILGTSSGRCCSIVGTLVPPLMTALQMVPLDAELASSMLLPLQNFLSSGDSLAKLVCALPSRFSHSHATWCMGACREGDCLVCLCCVCVVCVCMWGLHVFVNVYEECTRVCFVHLLCVYVVLFSPLSLTPFGWGWLFCFPGAKSFAVRGEIPCMRLWSQIHSAEKDLREHSPVRCLCLLSMQYTPVPSVSFAICSFEI